MEREARKSKDFMEFELMIGLGNESFELGDFLDKLKSIWKRVGKGGEGVF